LNTDILDFQLYLSSDKKNEEYLLKGSNSSEIFIVYSKKKDQTVDTSLLEKILNAVKLSLNNDVCSLEVQQNDKISFYHIANKVPLKKCIVFGISPLSMGLNFESPKYQLINFNEMTFLFSDSLDMIAQDKELKGALWAALKTMFL